MTERLVIVQADPNTFGGKGEGRRVQAFYFAVNNSYVMSFAVAKCAQFHCF